jgi:hypothetical protein
MFECELCGGPLMLLGQLGGRVHLTCRDCGAAFSCQADQGEELREDES